MSLTIFVGGALLLFSGSTPAVSSRLMWLEKFLPLSVLEISHFLGSLAGMGLLLLAWGLQRRLDAAYLLTLALLASGTIFSLLKGLDYEEAIVLLVILSALLPCRRHFCRKASLLSQHLIRAGLSSSLLCLRARSGWECFLISMWNTPAISGGILPFPATPPDFCVALLVP